jgi:hypothetical protein
VYTGSTFSHRLTAGQLASSGTTASAASMRQEAAG